jgi:hypothetical protein
MTPMTPLTHRQARRGHEFLGELAQQRRWQLLAQNYSAYVNRRKSLASRLLTAETARRALEGPSGGSTKPRARTPAGTLHHRTSDDVQRRNYPASFSLHTR